MSLQDSFNRSGLSKFLNRRAGRIFRLAAGLAFIGFGYAYRHHALGVISMFWGLLPLSAGAFDICYISAALGGPLAGPKIRGRQKTDLAAPR